MNNSGSAEQEDELEFVLTQPGQSPAPMAGFTLSQPLSPTGPTTRRLGFGLDSDQSEEQEDEAQEDESDSMDDSADDNEFTRRRNPTAYLEARALSLRTHKVAQSADADDYTELFECLKQTCENTVCCQQKCLLQVDLHRLCDRFQVLCKMDRIEKKRCAFLELLNFAEASRVDTSLLALTGRRYG